MSQVKDFLQDKQADSNLKEQLQLLVTLAQSKLEIMTKEIEDAFINKETEQKFRVIPGTSTEWITEYRVNAGSECSKQIGEVIDTFFEGDMVNGFKQLISASLNSFIGERTAGEEYKKYYFITMEHNTLIRVDVACWKYQFSSKSVIQNVENAFCYSFCKSVVDYNTISTAVLINQVSKLVNDNLDNVKEYLGKIKEVLCLIEDFSKRPVLKNVHAAKLLDEKTGKKELPITMKIEEKNVESIKKSMKPRYNLADIFK